MPPRARGVRGRRIGGAGSRVPDALAGTYAVRLRPADLPSKPPPELAPDNSPHSRKVVIANSGGPDDGPVLSIVNTKTGPLEGPALQVVGDELRLSNEECAAATGDTFVSSAYRWKLQGKALRLTTVKAGCPDKVAETILTSHALRRTGALRRGDRSAGPCGTGRPRRPGGSG